MTLDTGLQRRSFPRPLVTAQVWFAGERVKSQGFILEMPRADDDRGFPPRSMVKDLACKNTCIRIISSSNVFTTAQLEQLSKIPGSK